ncbi:MULTISPECIES: S4 domain-containing protein YaaA [Fructobacillus]|jgi:ribosome-associated protein|uniref:S4-like RNA-binding protein (YbcJ) n=1 Tax=Fructobacillus cardui TaxID=2893170 RepID=A0ABM9MZ23_9LACO|nr:S4 domain-containing protein YaaA [Fructobacillus sp. EFB-N1]KMK52853.1 ribosome-associated protein [Fructobacillus sp. EFB-N1]CAK1221489.1 Ribosome-associated protein YbcJ [Fructobacillus cardui]CAK1250078.1 Ribosome-associated protein YbcJ [Fructobacillus cardui]CAK1251090.1 Ribosome-associated protein YbcJ [Fructobacillus cardui]
MAERVAIKTAYITLAQLLKMENIIASGGQAKAFLAEQSVLLNGEEENRRGKKLYPGDQVDFQGARYLIDHQSAEEDAEEAEKQAILARFAAGQKQAAHKEKKRQTAISRQQRANKKAAQRSSNQKPSGPGSWN